MRLQNLSVTNLILASVAFGFNWTHLDWMG